MPDNPLQKILAEKIQALAERIRESQSEVSVKDLAELALFAQLLTLREKNKKRTRRRWILPLAFVFTLLLVSGLVFFHIDKAEIELDLSVTGVEFKLAGNQVLSGSLSVSMLGVSGLQKVSMPENVAMPDRQKHPQKNEPIALRLSQTGENHTKGIITLSSLLVPGETRVGVRRGERNSEYVLSLLGSGLIPQVNVHGMIEVSLYSTGMRVIDFKYPQAIELKSGPDEMEFVFKLFEKIPGVFVPRVLVRDLSFSQIDIFAEKEATLYRRVSTLISGTLFQQSLRGKQRVLRRNENIQFEVLKGEIQGLELHEDHISLRFYGQVRNLQINWGEETINLMPTYLEWLRTQHGLYLFWGSALYLFGLIAAVLRWWGIAI